MITLNEAFAIIDQKIKPKGFTTTVLKVEDALGRIVAQDQKSQFDIPQFNRAAMDGYAVIKNETNNELQILETVAAGKIATKKLQLGTTIKIMTGAPVPPDAGKIIPFELTTALAYNKVKIIAQDKNINISPQGEDLKRGDLIIKAGTKIGPVAIASLVMCGINELRVYQQPKVIIISTGDEIVDTATKLEPGKIMNCNEPMLNALCLQHGLEVVASITVPDDSALTVKTLREAASQTDFIVLSGGVSQGEFDYVGAAMKEIGFTLHFNRVALKPGKPTTFATYNDKLIFGLSGNPAAVFLTFHLFVLRALRHLLNIAEINNYLSLPLASNFKRKNIRRTEFIPCVLNSDGGLQPLEFHGSAHIVVLMLCNGFFIIEQNIAALKAGDRVKFLPIGV